jgi:hypothetical protein
VVAGLIHEEIFKFYSDTGLIADEAMDALIANSKEILKTSREVSFQILPTRALHGKRLVSCRLRGNDESTASVCA